MMREEVPVTKRVPAGEDIAAAGGSRWAVVGRLSLGRQLLYLVGQAIGDWWLAIES